MIRAEKLFQVLSGIHPLPRELKEALSKELQVVSFPRSHFLVQMQTVANYAYFLQNGFAVAYYLNDGRKIVTSFFKPNDIVFSPRSYFEQTSAEENIQLTTDSDLLSISYASVNKLMSKFPVVNFLARAVTAQYYSRSQERLIDFHNLNAWERYRRLVSNFPAIEQNASQELIASYINITPQSLSRLRHENK